MSYKKPKNPKTIYTRTTEVPKIQEPQPSRPRFYRIPKFSSILTHAEESQKFNKSELEKRITNVFKTFSYLSSSGEEICTTDKIGPMMRILGMCPTQTEIDEVIEEIENSEEKGTVKLETFVTNIFWKFLDLRYQPRPLEVLYENLAIRRRRNLSSTSNSQKSVLSILSEIEPLSSEYRKLDPDYEADPFIDNYNLAKKMNIMKTFNEVLAEIMEQVI